MAKGKSIEDFANTFDSRTIVPKRIRTALEGLGDSWLPEGEFASKAGVSLKHIPTYREKFSAHVVATNSTRGARYVWAGTKKFADKLREKLQ